MGAPDITGVITGSVFEDSGAVITGALTDSGNGVANTWSIASGAGYGTVSINAAGVWSYDLDDTNAAVNGLGAGDTLTDIFVVRVDDVFGSDTQTITITIHGVPCFAAATGIATIFGICPAGELKAGNLVLTRDNGLQPLRWVGGLHVSEAEMAEHERLRPVCIEAGALGNGLPRRRLVVSRQHRMLVSSALAREICGETEVLVPAVRLLGLPGVRLSEAAGPVDYVHLLFDRHEIVFAEGAPSESLLLGPQALEAVGEVARAEIALLFPQDAAEVCPARMIPPLVVQKSLMESHRSLPLLAGYGR